MSPIEFRRLYDTVFPVVFKVACHITRDDEAGQDICQNAFVKLHERDLTFPSAEEAKFWLIRVVKNEALNYIKHRSSEQKAFQKAFHEKTVAVATGEDEYLRKEARKEVQEALAKLPENLRMVLILKEYGELNYKEIGRTLGISEGNVKVRVFRARERLQNLLGDGKTGDNIEENKR
jgi:RNA polymerase sigma-70 factor (ECF subfamily)